MNTLENQAAKADTFQELHTARLNYLQLLKDIGNELKNVAVVTEFLNSEGIDPENFDLTELSNDLGEVEGKVGDLESALLKADEKIRTQDLFHDLFTGSIDDDEIDKVFAENLDKFKQFAADELLLAERLRKQLVKNREALVNQYESIEKSALASRERTQVEDDDIARL